MFKTVSKPLAHLIFLSGVNCYDIGSIHSSPVRDTKDDEVYVWNENTALRLATHTSRDQVKRRA
jgi:hypothetical protein